jgi:hypothetical protein
MAGQHVRAFSAVCSGDLMRFSENESKKEAKSPPWRTDFIF